MSGQPDIILEDRHNYVAFFLTLNCNLKCAYCINLHNDIKRLSQVKRGNLSTEEWIQAANRLQLRDDLPLTLQGGEPTLFEGFYRFVNEVNPAIKMDLLTNLTFDTSEFIKNAPLSRFTREAQYASIRVSYHPGQNDIEMLTSKTKQLENAGFRVGLYGVLHPDPEIHDHILSIQHQCTQQGIDFRTKEFLGFWQGKLYGTYKNPDAIFSEKLQPCRCRTTELIVDPAGYIYRCHADLYKGRTPIAHILDHSFSMKALDEFRHCDFYGECNPCDVKVTTNRFQEYGHTSVEIIDL